MTSRDFEKTAAEILERSFTKLREQFEKLKRDVVERRKDDENSPYAENEVSENTLNSLKSTKKAAPQRKPRKPLEKRGRDINTSVVRKRFPKRLASVENSLATQQNAQYKKTRPIRKNTNAVPGLDDIDGKVLHNPTNKEYYMVNKKIEALNKEESCVKAVVPSCTREAEVLRTPIQHMYAESNLVCEEATGTSKKKKKNKRAISHPT